MEAIEAILSRISSQDSGFVRHDGDGEGGVSGVLEVAHFCDGHVQLLPARAP